jgi:hypothetical protein
MLTIRFTAAIPAAVAGEVSRIEQFPAYQLAEGCAYKAAWDLLGSDFVKHCDAFAVDCRLMGDATRFAPGFVADVERGVASLSLGLRVPA